ncbi:MAG TPA: hypothetical protein VGQ95_00685 [Chthoniobacterales bacterium]|nr:hypothetical protein [Chthoniobacterales bacterium]
MHDLNVAALTLLGAIILFVFSQYLLKFVFEPISRVRRTLADISSTVLFNQAKITNGHADEDIATEIRKLSAGLRAAVFEVQFYRLFAQICGVPSEENARRACHQLNLLSSGMRPAAQAATPSTNWADANTLALDKLGELLGIQTKY